MTATVRLSSKYQVVIPQEARKAMSLSPGDELLVLSKPDRVVMIPRPKDFARHLSGLHRGAWSGAAAYLQEEREDW